MEGEDMKELQDNVAKGQKQSALKQNRKKEKGGGEYVIS